MALVAQEIAHDVERRRASAANWAQVIEWAGGLDGVACEVAGLAHDLGHPPFGHAGEVVLNRKLRENGVEDGFEGNAQSFRIVSRLDRRKPDSKIGLDLSRVTLAGILKYPSQCPPEKRLGGLQAGAALVRPPKFGAYISDGAAYEHAIALSLFGETMLRQTLEASIMDLADDITYAVHDFEDAYVENVIDFEDVRADLDLAQSTIRKKALADLTRDDSNYFIYYAADLRDKYPGYFNKDLYWAALGKVRSLIVDNNFVRKYTGSPEQAANASSALSDVIEDILKGLQLSAVPPWMNGPSVFVDEPAWHLVQVLKTVSRRYVIGSSQVGLLERAQASALNRLYDGLKAWLEDGPAISELPQPLSQYLLDSEQGYETYHVVGSVGPIEHRALGDYICSLSDRECLDQSDFFSGNRLPTPRSGL